MYTFSSTIVSLTLNHSTLKCKGQSVWNESSEDNIAETERELHLLLLTKLTKNQMKLVMHPLSLCNYASKRWWFSFISVVWSCQNYCICHWTIEQDSGNWRVKCFNVEGAAVETIYLTMKENLSSPLAKK